MVKSITAEKYNTLKLTLIKKKHARKIKWRRYVKI